MFTEKTISDSHGLVQYTKKGIAGNITKEMPAIFESLLNVAKEHGGNAVINVNVVTGSYDQQGAKFETTYIVAYGESVTLD